MNGNSEWFAPKRYGYGAGLPIAWQGWVVALGFFLVCAADVCFFGNRPLPLMAVLIPAIVTLLVITARTTRGGWRWRWGDED